MLYLYILYIYTYTRVYSHFPTAVGFGRKATFNDSYFPLPPNNSGLPKLDIKSRVEQIKWTVLLRFYFVFSTVLARMKC